MLNIHTTISSGKRKKVHLHKFCILYKSEVLHLTVSISECSTPLPLQNMDFLLLLLIVFFFLYLFKYICQINSLKLEIEFFVLP